MTLVQHGVVDTPTPKLNQGWEYPHYHGPTQSFTGQDHKQQYMSWRKKVKKDNVIRFISTQIAIWGITHSWGVLPQADVQLST